jgi:hypothetical protein
MDKLVQGYWDCPYCGTKGISGLNKRCTSCGHPQDEGTKFYMKKEKEYLDENKAKDYGKGADWTCSYCGALNRYDAKVCVGCGADREESSGDYFENVENQKKKEEAKKQEQQQLMNNSQQPTGGLKKRLPLLIGIAILIAFIAFSCRPKNYSAEVTAKTWGRVISVEAYRTVEESDWSVPDGGRVTEERREVHHYDQVLDHYETVEVQRSREVQDGYDTHTEYVDNGDGTFTERTYETPRYVTEYYTEEEERPVYVNVPDYRTKYYYEIERWLPDHTLETSGNSEEPYWDDTPLKENERESGRAASYKITFGTDKNKSYVTEVDEDTWRSLNIGDGADIVTRNGNVISINGKEL